MIGVNQKSKGMCSATHESEIAAGERFAFGDNWRRFLAGMSDGKILEAEESLRHMLGVESLQGMTFLDAGSGSGLFSLAAVRLGASVVSFDFDPASVSCTKYLKNQYASDANWKVLEGSVLDPDFLKGLGVFDIVYSWGVLHHTGDMHLAFKNVQGLVKPSGGMLFVAIYNDQYWISRYWTFVKRAYNRWPVLRPVVVGLHTPYLIGGRWTARKLSGRGKLDRGMHIWHDMIDWLGGYPFEVATPEAVFEYFHQYGFQLKKLKTCSGRMGCNQFVFERV